MSYTPVRFTGNNGHTQALHFDRPPRRVVSLVPSLTESMFDLGLGSTVAGITDYCVHPAPQLDHLPRLGGPKNPRVSDILDLKPDLVLANKEENTPQTVAALEGAGLKVWVSFPTSVRQAMDVLWTIVGLFQSPTAALRLETIQRPLDWSEAAATSNLPQSYFCPIWEDTPPGGPHWWMTFNSQTYASDLLRLMGGSNVFGERVRRYPLEADLGLAQADPSGERDTRYPRVTLEEVIAAQPELILLPSEPFAYEESHRQAVNHLFAGTPAVQNERVYLLDGSLITWHGTRLARALAELPELFTPDYSNTTGLG